MLAELGRQKVGRVDVICPGFVSDCLETLEEIAIEGKSIFLNAGGREFHHIPCLNERNDWMHALADLVLANLPGWTAGAPTPSARRPDCARSPWARKPEPMRILARVDHQCALAPRAAVSLRRHPGGELLHGADRRAPARLVNAVARPILIVLTLPLTVLTLGLFIFVINGLLFWFVASFVDGFAVSGFWTAVAGAIAYSVISWACSALILAAGKSRLSGVEAAAAPRIEMNMAYSIHEPLEVMGTAQYAGLIGEPHADIPEVAGS